MTKLVIVESPTKAKTIRNFLPNEYRVEASMGHVRDLPASASEIPAAYKGEPWARLGVNVEQEFDPLYVVPGSKKKVVKQLKDLLKNADELILATDEDREGESIGWHLYEVLKPKVPVQRMVFHEITREAIQEALQHTRTIDENLVRAQETRRIVDRLVGYTISPLLWKKIAPKLSAGRVQSVAVRLLVLRERERRAFVSGTYWDLKALLNKRPDQPDHRFEAQLVSVGGTRVATGRDFEDALLGTPDFAIEKTLIGQDPFRTGDLLSFRIRITNTGDFPITFLALRDTYDTVYLTYAGSTPPSDDNIGDGVIDWSDLTAGQQVNGCGVDLAVNAVCEVVVDFVAKLDTSLLQPDSKTENTATTNGVEAGNLTIPDKSDSARVQ
ncbi:MAG: hypothetical protein KDE20_20265, partial [Caldilineaceae bacterium]|nr:hypothetical protein [Caldilineaceae bacterium]